MSPECNELKVQQGCNEIGMQQDCNELGVQQTCNKLGCNKCATNWECNEHVMSRQSNKRATSCRAHLYDCTLTLLPTTCQQHRMTAIARPEEHRVGDRKVATPRCDSRTGNALLFWDTLHAYFSLGPSNLPVVVAQPDKRLANGTQNNALHWCG